MFMCKIPTSEGDEFIIVDSKETFDKIAQLNEGMFAGCNSMYHPGEMEFNVDCECWTCETVTTPETFLADDANMLVTEKSFKQAWSDNPADMEGTWQELPTFGGCVSDVICPSCK